MADKAVREREAILRAAYSLIGRPGSSSVSVHDILEAAGLSTRAFYRHFHSKDELVLTMYRTAAERINAELETEVTAAPSPAVALEAFIRRYLAVAYDTRRTRQAVALMSPEVRATAGFDHTDQELVAARRCIVADLLRTGLADGTFPRVADPDEDARAVLSVVSGLILAAVTGEPAPSWDDATAHITGLFLRAFGVTTAG